MEMPLLKSWINNIVRQGIFDALVDPGKFLIDLKNENMPIAIPSEIPAKTRGNDNLSNLLSLFYYKLFDFCWNPIAVCIIGSTVINLQYLPLVSG